MVCSTASWIVCGSDSEDEAGRGIRASQSLWPDKRAGLLPIVEGLDFAEGFEEVLKVYSEIKDGISLRAADSFVLVLWDEIVYKS